MTIKIYGVLRSVPVQRVVLVCVEKNVPYELVEVDVKNKEHKTPSFLEKHPFGQIPYIDDDGFILYESRAIGHYIAKKYASQGTPGLVPTDLKEEAIYQQAVLAELSHFNPHASTLAVEKLYKGRYLNLETDESKVKETLATFGAKLDAYDVILGKQKYLAGDDVTLADLNHLPFGNIIEHDIGLDLFQTRPNVARWWGDISSRPSWVTLRDQFAL